MKLGLHLGDDGARLNDLLPVVHAAERCGYDSVWLGEAYASDAVSALGFIAGRTERVGIGSAVLMMHGRSPAMTAMTAMTLDHISKGRFNLGLGVSGPQVVEGWHGVRYGKPLAYTREFVTVVRAMVAREAPVEFAGSEIQVPFTGPGATGLGKPLRSALRPLRPRVPILLAAIGPRNARLAGEMADGWLPIFFSPERQDVLCDPFDQGLADSGRQPGDVEVVVSPPLASGDDLDACRDEVRPMLALYIGGMGARGRNFYFDLACRYGFEAEARTIQDHYLEGRKADAIAAVPDALVDETCLVGTPEQIIDRLDAWRESRATTVCLRTTDPELVERLAPT